MDAQLAKETLDEENAYRFPSFSASDAVTLGLSLRKRFRSSVRHSKGRGLLISIVSIAGHTLFACTVGDESNLTGVSLDSWSCLESMIAVVKRTGHSSYYVEKGMSAMGRATKNVGLQSDCGVQGGAFPIWLENGHCCPIAIVACYSGSSQDDHNLVATTVRDYLNKIRRNSEGTALSAPTMPAPSTIMPVHTGRDSEWQGTFAPQPESVLEHEEHV